MRLHKGLGILVVWLAAVTSTGCSSNDDDSGTCTQGELGCSCYANATCNGALACMNNQCVQTTSGVGGSTAVTTVPGNGGSTTAGVGGTTAAGTTSAPCSNTLTDPNNCGKCGHVCRAGTCNNGTCPVAFSVCIPPPVQFASCDAYCASIGQDCAVSACHGDTAWSWSTQAGCDSGTTPDWDERTICSAAIVHAASAFVRCCCTDD